MDALNWRVLMKPAIALLALLVVACGGSSGGSSSTPTTPTVPSGPTDKVDGGMWSQRTPLLEANSELAFAAAGGKLYLLGGYPSNRSTARTVQIYTLASDRWDLGPQLPQPNNHGMAAGVGGRIYVAGGRPPRERDFAVYDPGTDTWEVLPLLPTQRNHLTGEAINGRIHVVGGRQGDGLSPIMTTAHEVFDPQSRSWTTAAPMLRARSGMNGVMARGCFHVWGGEGPAGMFPYYDPKTDKWTRLRDMPTPVHGVYGSAYMDGLIWASGGGTNIGGNFGSLLNQVFLPTVSCD
jgi:hypothetical protein